MKQLNRGMTVGLGFILVPIVIIFGYFSYLWLFTFDTAVCKSAVDAVGGGMVMPTHPTAQILIGAGTCFMSVCYGVAKIITSIRRA